MRSDGLMVRRYVTRGFVLCLLLVGSAILVKPLVDRARTQRAAVQAIEDLGGSVTYDFEFQDRAEPPGPRWLRSLIGDDYFMRVESVMLWDPAIGDRELAHVRDLAQVKRLYLTGTQVTDASVPELAKMHSLERLTVGDTQISVDAKLRLMRDLPGCFIR